MRAAGDEGRQRAEALLLAGGRRPARPLLHAADLGDAAPDLGVLADGYAVADRLVVRLDVVQELGVGIDDDRARRFLAVERDDVAPELLGDGGLRIGQVRPQLLVADGPARLAAWRQRLF